MRFDGKNNKQIAKQISIGELSGVTVPAVQGSNATLRKYASPPPTNSDMVTLAKATFNEVILREQNSRQARRELEPVMEQLNDCEHALWQANHDAIEKGDTEQVTNNIREFAMSLLTMHKAASLEELLGMAIDDSKRDEIEHMLEDPLNGDTLEARIKTVRSKLSKQATDDYAYKPDPEKRSTWKLPIDTPARVTAAAEALSPSGFRGEQVKIPEADLSAVKAKVRAAWLKAYPDKSESDLPASLRKSQMNENEIAELQALAEMNDVQKAHYKGLTETTERESFVKMSDTERSAMVELVKGADETYTTAGGTKLSKMAVGSEVFEMLKSQDQELVKMRHENEMQSFVKAAKADDRKHLPGDEKTKARALREVDKLPEDVKKCITEMFNAGNSALAKSYEAQASSHTTIRKGEDVLDTLAKAYAKDHNVSYAQAYNDVLDTPEGIAAYEQSQEG